MSSELWVRVGVNDHEIIDEMLGPGSQSVFQLRSRRVIGGLLADAQVAIRRPDIQKIAARAGIPFIIDPLTHLLATPLATADRWAQLPFGDSSAQTIDFITDEFRMNDLVQKVVEFELNNGATYVIPPYLYCPSPNSREFALTLLMAEKTANLLRDEGIKLPMQFVLCGQLKAFTQSDARSQALTRLSFLASQLPIDRMAVCLSPAGAPDDSYGKVQNLFTFVLELQNQIGDKVIAWRQGVYGQGLVAAGIRGFECGLGTGEQTNIPASMRSRMPRSDGKKKRGGAGPGIFFEPLGRSVGTKVGQALLGNMGMRARLMCDDELCCPNGASDMIDNRRSHALRTRARQLADVDAIPQLGWKLQKQEDHARLAKALSDQANKVLGTENVGRRIEPKAMEALAKVLGQLKDNLAIDGAAEGK